MHKHSPFTNRGEVSGNKTWNKVFYVFPDEILATQQLMPFFLRGVKFVVGVRKKSQEIFPKNGKNSNIFSAFT